MTFRDILILFGMIWVVYLASWIPVIAGYAE